MDHTRPRPLVNPEDLLARWRDDERPLAIVPLREVVELVDAAIDTIGQLVAAQPPQPEYVPARDVCRALSISPPTLSRMVARGLPHITAGSERRYSITEVVEWLRERQQEAA